MKRKKENISSVLSGRRSIIEKASLVYVLTITIRNCRLGLPKYSNGTC